MFDDLIFGKKEKGEKYNESLRCKGFTNVIHVSIEDWLNCPFCNGKQEAEPASKINGVGKTSGTCGCGGHDSGQTGPCGSPNKSAGTP